jgi:hypothetical protein
VGQQVHFRVILVLLDHERPDAQRQHARVSALQNSSS